VLKKFRKEHSAQSHSKEGYYIMVKERGEGEKERENQRDDIGCLEIEQVLKENSEVPRREPWMTSRMQQGLGLEDS